VTQGLTYDDFVCHFLGKTEVVKVKSRDVGKLKTGVDDLEFHKVIGTGGFSKVYLVKHRQTREFFALKSIKMPANKYGKDKETFLQQIKYEKQILMHLKHPFIVKLKYAFYEKRRFFLAMGLVQGGEFVSYIRTTEKKKKEDVYARLTQHEVLRGADRDGLELHACEGHCVRRPEAREHLDRQLRLHQDDRLRRLADAQRPQKHRRLRRHPRLPR
jgi:hypothetical protein